ncbi:MAG: hypothetical protein J5527_02180 [Treponema sp.]|nr:hypothetical protein [Treponema sp.]
MEQFDLNKIPEQINSGEISRSCAVHQLAMFLSKNPALFGLNKKDEDFKSEVILLFLEKGEATIELYNPNYGTFFTYFFCFIKSLTNSVKRSRAAKEVQEYHSISESITGYDQKEERYSKIDYKEFEMPKAPLSYKPVSPEAFQIACKESQYNISDFLEKDDDESLDHLKEKLQMLSPSMAERILIVLALKSAYYISDRQIKTISEICKLNSDEFQNTIQQLKQELIYREANKMNLELRRNKAYYHHKKYKSRLEWTKLNRDDFSEQERLALITKYNRQTENWIKLNAQLKKGIINIRPTNKRIASVLGLCERQISYYIRNANILGIEL